MGREKHYYLTEHGQQLYSAMKARYERSYLSDDMKLVIKMVSTLQMIYDNHYEIFSNAGQSRNKNNVHLRRLKSEFGNVEVFPERNEGRNYLMVDGLLGKKNYLE